MASVRGGIDIFVQRFSEYNVVVTPLNLAEGRWPYQCWADFTLPPFLVTVPAYLPAQLQLRFIDTELRLRGLSRGA